MTYSGETLFLNNKKIKRLKIYNPQKILYSRFLYFEGNNVAHLIYIFLNGWWPIL